MKQLQPGDMKDREEVRACGQCEVAMSWANYGDGKQGWLCEKCGIFFQIVPRSQKRMSEELKEIKRLQDRITELESRQIVHLSLRLAGITGRGTTLLGKKPEPDHLGIAVYFIFGPPGKPQDSEGYGLAFGLSPEKYASLMATGSAEIVIHEVKPENSRTNERGRWPIEFLTEGETQGG